MKILKIGIILLLVGTSPLALIILASKIGIGDPNPNPVGPGLLAAITFWPAVILIMVGVGKVAYIKYLKK